MISEKEYIEYLTIKKLGTKKTNYLKNFWNDPPIKSSIGYSRGRAKYCDPNFQHIPFEELPFDILYEMSQSRDFKNYCWKRNLLEKLTVWLGL